MSVDFANQDAAVRNDASPGYATLRRHFADLIAAAQFKPVTRSTRVSDRLLQSAIAAYGRADSRTAAEVFTLATEVDTVSELAFLGAALANLDINRTGIARANLVQARTLHDFVGARSHLDRYDLMIASLDGRTPTAEEAQISPVPAGADEDTRWFLRYARRHPKRFLLQDEHGFETYFLDGLLPPQPIINNGDRIATIGSCFAENLSRALMRDGETHLPVDDTFFTTFVLREAFEYAFGGDEARAHWYRDSQGNTPEHGAGYSVDRVRAALSAGDAYVITLGLSEIWYNRRTGAVYPSGVHITAFDPDEHGFRVSTVEENIDNLEAIRELVRVHRGNVPIILTLSPVPLAATFREINCVAANGVSKAILRIAIDRFMESHPDDPGLFYFPSYEIVRDYFVDPYLPDMRHVKSNVVDFVIGQFRRAFISQ